MIKPKPLLAAGLVATAQNSEIFEKEAWNIFNGVPFVKSIYKIFVKKFIRQDQQIMEKQSIGLRDNPNLILIDDADTQAKWYFQLKQAYQKAQQNGGEMEHPIKEGVTLRWRS